MIWLGYAQVISHWDYENSVIEAGQLIPSNFSSNDNYNSKGKKSSENKIGQMEASNSATPVELAICKLWQPLHKTKDFNP